MLASAPVARVLPRREKDFKLVSQVLRGSNHNNMYVGWYNLVSEAYHLHAR